MSENTIERAHWEDNPLLDVTTAVTLLSLMTLTPLVMKVWSGAPNNWVLLLVLSGISSLLWGIGALWPLFAPRQIYEPGLANGLAALFAFMAASAGISYPDAWLSWGIPIS
jgi:hypothetical protein